MNIRISNKTDRFEVLNIHRKAFGEQEGEVISQLVDDLFEDPTASPLSSFVAVEGTAIVGHILFTKVSIVGAFKGLSAQILAPLAVLPDFQGRGVGCQLIETGLSELKKSGVKLIQKMHTAASTT